MRKLCYLLVLLVCSLSSVSALEHYVGGDYGFYLVNPDLLSGAGSAAGGGFFSSGPSSIVMNPALTAGDQRIMLNVGYTPLFNGSMPGQFGSGAQLSLLIPSRWGVFSTTVDGIFCNVGKLQLDNIIQGRGGFSKDITDRLYAGLAFHIGARWGAISDWSIGFDLGIVYRWGNLGFLRDTRIAATLTNLGKPYQLGMPSIATPKVGIAATLFSSANDAVAGSFSADLSFPQFTNMVLDTGFQLRIAHVVTVKSGWQLNLRDVIDGHYNLVPSVGVSVNFDITTKSSGFMAKKGWQRSEITTSAAWQNLYQDVHAVSVGAAVNLGLRDNNAPEIILWNEE